MFIGFNKDTLPSVALLHSSNRSLSTPEIIEKCKEDLIS